MMINLILDPEVLKSTGKGNECEAMLLLIQQNQSSLVFVVDGKGKKMRVAYEEFIHANLKDRRKSVATAIAKRILNGPKWEVSLCQLPDRVQDALTTCSKYSDPYLLQLVAELVRYEASCIILVLTKSSGIGKDCLCQKSVKQQLEKEISQLRILHDLIRNINLRTICPSPQDLTNDRQHVNRFEQMAEIWLSRHFECQIASVDEHEFKIHALHELFDETEFSIVLGRREKVELDVYCYQTGKEERLVCVGECKLSFSKDFAEDYVDTRAVKQLVVEMQIVEKWERRRTDKNGNTLGPSKIQGYIISNGDMSKEACELAKEYGIKFIKVTMPTNWKTNPCWRLTEDRFKFINI